MPCRAEANTIYCFFGGEFSGLLPGNLQDDFLFSSLPVVSRFSVHAVDLIFALYFLYPSLSLLSQGQFFLKKVLFFFRVALYPLRQ